MKLPGFLLALPIVVGVAACDKSGSLKKGVVVLSGCRTEVFGNEEVKICYDSLVSDSRCPADGVCIWQGEATGKFSFTVNNATKHTLALSTLNYGPYNRDTIVGNYKIELLAIDPYPRVHAPRPASASVNITKL